jgi:hypothetical protein
MKRPHSSSSSHPLSKVDEPEKKRLLLDETVDNSSSSTVSIALYEPLATLISQPTATYSRQCSLRSPMASTAAETLSTNTTSKSSIPDLNGVLISKSSEAPGLSRIDPLRSAKVNNVVKTEVDSACRLDEATFFSSELSEDASSHTLKCINKAFKLASAATFFSWVLLTTLVYCWTPGQHFRPATRWERYTATLAAFILLISLLTQCIPLFMRGWKHAMSGVVVGVLVVQVVAILTNLLLAFFPIPVMVDPVTQLAVYQTRWCEFTVLSFMMCFLTEGGEANLTRHSIIWLIQQFFLRTCFFTNIFS